MTGAVCSEIGLWSTNCTEAQAKKERCFSQEAEVMCTCLIGLTISYVQLTAQMIWSGCWPQIPSGQSQNASRHFHRRSTGFLCRNIRREGTEMVPCWAIHTLSSLENSEFRGSCLDSSYLKARSVSICRRPIAAVFFWQITWLLLEKTRMDDNDELRADGRRPKEVLCQMRNQRKNSFSWNGETSPFSIVQCCSE